MDIGKLGSDEGKGGRFVILPPGHTDPVPDGFIPLPCDTCNSYPLIRSVLTERTKGALDRSLEICHRMRIYPLSQAESPSDNERVDLLPRGPGLRRDAHNHRHRARPGVQA